MRVVHPGPATIDVGYHARQLTIAKFASPHLPRHTTHYPARPNRALLGSARPRAMAGEGDTRSSKEEFPKRPAFAR